jgi:hypothetical protein
MYQIDFDEDRLMVVATLDGYWTLETLDDYASELFALMRQVGRRHNFMRMLARSATMSVQSPEVSAGFGKIVADLTGLCPGPIAITVGSMLNKIQASRAMAHERIRIFQDEEEACQWLMSIGPVADAPIGLSGGQR